jgi:hypothetical protein
MGNFHQTTHLNPSNRKQYLSGKTTFPILNRGMEKHIAHLLAHNFRWITSVFSVVGLCSLPDYWGFGIGIVLFVAILNRWTAARPIPLFVAFPELVSRSTKWTVKSLLIITICFCAIHWFPWRYSYLQSSNGSIYRRYDRFSGKSWILLLGGNYRWGETSIIEPEKFGEHDLPAK